jgi:hypothetical protein
VRSASFLLFLSLSIYIIAKDRCSLLSFGFLKSLIFCFVAENK